MLAAALLAAAILHTAGPSPAAQLAAVERAATFQVLLLPSSTQLLRAEVSRDNARVRLEYAIEGSVIRVDEHVETAADQASPDAQGDLFDLEGYPALYETYAGSNGLSALTWYRPDVLVTLSSRDTVSEPLLIDVALELR